VFIGRLAVGAKVSFEAKCSNLYFCWQWKSNIDVSFSTQLKKVGIKICV